MGDKRRILTPMPQISVDIIKDLVKELYDLENITIKYMPSDEDANFHIKPIEIKENVDIPEHGYNLKVVNSYFTQNRDILNGIFKVMEYLSKCGIKCPSLIKLKSEEYFVLKDFSFGTHFVRLQTYIQGFPLYCMENAAYSQIFYDIGKQLGKMHKHFEKLEYIKELDRDVGSLDFKNFSNIREFNMLQYVNNEEDRELLIKVIDNFTENVMPNWDMLPDQLIHGDMNYANVIIKEDGKRSNFGSKLQCYKIQGIIDFGLVHYSKRMFDLAICICYMLSYAKDGHESFSTAGYAIAGYIEVVELTSLEFSLLKYSAMARLAMSLLLQAYLNRSKKVESESKETVLRKKWNALFNIFNIPNNELIQIWRSVIDLCKK